MLELLYFKNRQYFTRWCRYSVVAIFRLSRRKILSQCFVTIWLVVWFDCLILYSSHFSDSVKQGALVKSSKGSEPSRCRITAFLGSRRVIPTTQPFLCVHISGVRVHWSPIACRVRARAPHRINNVEEEEKNQHRCTSKMSRFVSRLVNTRVFPCVMRSLWGSRRATKRRSRPSEKEFNRPSRTNAVWRFSFRVRSRVAGVFVPGNFFLPRKSSTTKKWNAWSASTVASLLAHRAPLFVVGELGKKWDWEEKNEINPALFSPSYVSLGNWYPAFHSEEGRVHQVQAKTWSCIITQ